MSLEKMRGLLKQERRAHEPPRHPVVVIDDDPLIRDGLSVLLCDVYELALCLDAQSGVRAVTQDTCAVVVDIKMVGLDGFWACNEIRKCSPTVPVIFYSAYQDIKNPYEIINDHRPFGYVAKGGDVTRLTDMLALAVELHSVIISNRRVAERLDRLRGSAC